MHLRTSWVVKSLCLRRSTIVLARISLVVLNRLNDDSFQHIKYYNNIVKYSFFRQTPMNVIFRVDSILYYIDLFTTIDFIIIIGGLHEFKSDPHDHFAYIFWQESNSGISSFRNKIEYLNVMSTILFITRS